MNDLDFSKRPAWELTAMKKALSSLPALNSPQQNAELDAIKRELAKRRQQTRIITKSRKG